MMGGGEFVCLNAMEALQKAGNTVNLYTFKPFDWNRVDRILGRRVRPDKSHHIECLRFLKAFEIYKNLICGFDLREIKSEVDLTFNTQGGSLIVDSDLVYMHFPLSLQFGGPYSILPLESMSLMRKIYTIPFFQAVQSLERKLGRTLIANSKYTAYNIKKCLGRESQIVYPPVDVEACQRLAGKPRGGSKVLSISRFASGKNLELIPWIASKTDKNIEFEIIGSTSKEGGEIYDKVLEGIAKYGVKGRITISFNVSNAEKMRLLGDSKVFLHLIRSEPFGISVAEALSAGLIPLVHRSGGQREIAPPEWQYEDFSEVPKLVSRAFSVWNPELSSNLSRPAARFKTERFSNEIVDLVNRFRKRMKI